MLGYQALYTQYFYARYLHTSSRLLFVLLCFIGITIPLHAIELNGIQKYAISWTTDVTSHLPESTSGYPIGSGLSFVKVNRSKKSLFYSVSDQSVSGNNGSSYPFVAILGLRADKVSVDQVLPIVVDKSSAKYLRDPLDIEGVATAPGGIIWLADEAVPSLLKVHAKSGLILDRLMPGDGLPKDLSLRQDNRGIEGVSVFPNGDLFVVLQSVLKDSEETGQFIRFLRVDPKSRVAKTFAYPVEQDQYTSISEVKIGAAQVIDDGRALVIEHGPSSEEGKTNARIFVTSIPNNAGEQLATKFPYLTKELLIDLKEHGYSLEKPEGIALFDSGYSVAVTNDPGEGEKEYLWVFSLKESLTPWTWVEWFIALFLILATLFFTAFSIHILFLTFRRKSA